MKTLPIFLFVLLFAFGENVNAQDFLEGSSSFSKRKDAHITLKNGTEITGKVDKPKFKKRLIERIRVTTADGDKRVLQAEDIDFMYVPPSGLDKLGRGLDKFYTVSKWDRDSGINEEYIKEGYVYYESSEFVIGRKTVPVLAQLINPGYSNEIRVYHDPLAKESAGVSAGGFQLTGGDAKSYYIKIGNEPAYRFQRKDYRNADKELYHNCKGLLDHFEGNLRWPDFSKHLYYYSTECVD
nr:hypothetical protein [Saprospiraceae bacterium]